MTTAYDPRVAFGLKAMTLALKAKCGRATHKMAVALRVDCYDLIGEDPVAIAAANAFIRDVDIDQGKAGAALLEFCTRWPDRAMADLARTTENALQSAEAQLHDWQKRKDCGHD